MLMQVVKPDAGLGWYVPAAICLTHAGQLQMEAYVAGGLCTL